ncbi:thermonuclease family protein [Aeromicrobium fastidiosum]|uniref:Thermonuclease family protein n=2 Tax=Aeromicrobium fastidiosum TaxID=52699 RepID=A0A641AL86_9ACTN|nr:thermonuclease family protein [Aeromicrobium fastidiosum]
MVKGRIERVRLIGIDTPELGRDGAADQCHAREATRQMSRLVKGSRVQLQRDRTQANRDAYGRLLRYVYAGGNRRDVGRTLVANGHGREYTFKGRAYRHRSAHLKAQRSAQKARRGLWGGCAAPTAPPPVPAPPAPVGQDGCLIKGNIASDGEKIYHVPGQQNYDETRIDTARGERWFCTEDDAVAAGWRRAAR